MSFFFLAFVFYQVHNGFQDVFYFATDPRFLLPNRSECNGFQDVIYAILESRLCTINSKSLWAISRRPEFSVCPVVIRQALGIQL